VTERRDQFGWSAHPAGGIEFNDGLGSESAPSAKHHASHDGQGRATGDPEESEQCGQHHGSHSALSIPRHFCEGNRMEAAGIAVFVEARIFLPSPTSYCDGPWKKSARLRRLNLEKGDYFAHRVLKAEKGHDRSEVPHVLHLAAYAPRLDSA